MNRYVVYSREYYVIDTDDREIAERLLTATQDDEAYILDSMTGERIT